MENTTTAGAPDWVGDMAHRIADEIYAGNVPAWAYAKSAAKAAIIETTEAAARLIDHQTPPPVGGPLSHTNSMRVVMQDAARALRNNAHLKGPKP